mmetsp:Transcript_53155/g.108417  ORF Transcript_53155/g.108417 Transcript_53155/m.108417 type:complete len:238 (-) Transcript_53155:167-880(-)
MTLLTRAMMANTAASDITVVEIPAFASSLAMSWPSREGAFSETTTSKRRPRDDTSLRKCSVVLLNPHVRITSLEWTCSMAWSATCSLMASISLISSMISALTSCLKFVGTSSVQFWERERERSPSRTLPREGAWRVTCPPPSSARPSPSLLAAWEALACSSRMMKRTRRTMLPTVSSAGEACASFLPTARTSSRSFLGLFPFVPEMTFRKAVAVSIATSLLDNCLLFSFMRRASTCA